MPTLNEETTVNNASPLQGQARDALGGVHVCPGASPSPFGASRKFTEVNFDP